MPPKYELFSVCSYCYRDTNHETILILEKTRFLVLGWFCGNPYYLLTVFFFNPCNLYLTCFCWLMLDCHINDALFVGFRRKSNFGTACCLICYILIQPIHFLHKYIVATSYYTQNALQRDIHYLSTQTSGWFYFHFTFVSSEYIQFSWNGGLNLLQWWNERIPLVMREKRTNDNSSFSRKRLARYNI